MLYKVAGIDKLLHPVFAVNNGGFNKNFAKIKRKSVVRGQKNDCRMAFAVFFVKTVLYSYVAVVELINFKTAAAKIKIRIVFVGRNKRFFCRNVIIYKLCAFCVADISRLTEAAVFYISQTA